MLPRLMRFWRIKTRQDGSSGIDLMNLWMGPTTSGSSTIWTLSGALTCLTCLRLHATSLYTTTSSQTTTAALCAVMTGPGCCWTVSIPGRKYSWRRRRTMAETRNQLCWSCAKACGGCSWSRNFTPIHGWDATPYRRVYRDAAVGTRYVDSYIIRRCPEYVNG